MARVIRTYNRISGSVSRRSVAHTATSIGTHFGISFGLTWLVTGQAIVSGAIAILEPILCHFAHQGHDWLWARQGGGSGHFMHGARAC